jgi:hypothetical protein
MLLHQAECRTSSKSQRYRKIGTESHGFQNEIAGVALKGGVIRLFIFINTITKYYERRFLNEKIINNLNRYCLVWNGFTG